jgi:predicted DNA-binding protein with PD1-like motif
MTANLQEARPGRIFIGRLATGSDLVDEIERFCAEHSIVAGWVSVVGAVRHAAYACYEQREKRYIELASDTHGEIAGFVGNVSLRDDKPFLHAHATFADDSGATVGGHLLRGTEVFVGEVQITELTDVSLVRTFDDETGLALF